MSETIETDFLVIGSGVAGLAFAIQAEKHGKVTIVTKKEIMESNTNLAQGGIAAVLGKNDSFELHIRDTLKVGCGLCDLAAVETLVRNGPAAINWLINQGVEFDREKDIALSIESGHSRRRIAHKGDYTGREIEEALVASVRKKNIATYENCLALNLVTQSQQCLGANILDLKREKTLVFQAKTTVLATGGIGQIYAHTSNPTIATGDGVAMAYRAGARIQDMEFIQFHPTTLPRKGEPNFLISETVRGEGGVLRNEAGEPFMARYHPDGDLAPRDIVSRAVYLELQKGKVYLDLTQKSSQYIMERFPTIYTECLRQGIDITKRQIPITPAAHYLCGGIKVGLNGESTIRHLFALGECSATGVHGANRLASNSLLESVVFSLHAAQKAKTYLKDTQPQLQPPTQKPNIVFDGARDDAQTRKTLQSLMWDKVGIIRREADLAQALSQLQTLTQKIEKRNKDGKSQATHTSLIELQNMLTIATLTTTAAHLRKESRGTHYLAEHPEQDDQNWKKHITFENNKTTITD